MKYTFFAALFLLLACSPAKTTTADRPGEVNNSNSLLIRKYAVIGYEPGLIYNWSTISVLMPGARIRCNCPVGTKIYLANAQQVKTVMGGGNIRSDTPFLIVKAEDAGKSFKLRNGNE